MKTKLDVAVPQTLDSLEPIELIDKANGLRGAFVERYALQALSNGDWDKETRGFYVLLSHINPDNTFTAYVGQTDYSFARRLRDHDGTKDYWNLAVLFKRDNNEDPFNRSETRFLEGAMVEALQSSPNVTVMNQKPTGEKILSDWDKPYMEQVLLSALRILFLRGYRNSHMGAITRHLESKASAPSPVANNAQVRETVTPPAFPVLSMNHQVKAPVEQDLHPVLRAIAQDIHQQLKNVGVVDKFYKTWASDKNIAAIIESRPTTEAELQAIQGVGARFLSRADEITKLFRPAS